MHWSDRRASVLTYRGRQRTKGSHKIPYSVRKQLIWVWELPRCRSRNPVALVIEIREAVSSLNIRVQIWASQQRLLKLTSISFVLVFVQGVISFAG